MSLRLAWRNVALMVLFSAIGLAKFTENVRAVQVVGLFASGVLFGTAVTMLIFALKTRKSNQEAAK